MKYFLEEDYYNYTEGEAEYVVFYDDESELKIQFTEIDTIYDEKGVRYINLSELSDLRDGCISEAFGNIDALIKAEMEDNEAQYTALEKAKNQLDAEYRETKIFPFVEYDEFIDVLHDCLGEESINQLYIDLVESDYDDE